MRILICGSKDKYGLGYSYKRAFNTLGHWSEVFPIEELYDNKLDKINFFRNRYFRGICHRLLWKLLCKSLNDEFIRRAIDDKPDLIFIHKGWHVSPKTILRLKSMTPGFLIFCFNQENPFNTWNFAYTNSWVINSIPLFDSYFTWGKFLLEKIRKEGGTELVEYLPFAFDENIHYPITLMGKDVEKYTADISFIGTRDKEREAWLEYLTDFDFKIWGNDWHKASLGLRRRWQKESAEGEKFSKVCAGSKIVIDILRRQMFPAHSMKTFEIPACRGFLMCNKGGEVHDFFKEGREMVTFSSPEEMVQKVKFYLKQDQLRVKIAEAGYRKVLNFPYVNCARRVIDIYEEFKNNSK